MQDTEPGRRSMEYGLIGAKLGHSHSPRIHRAFFDYDYVLRELTAEELPGFLAEASLAASPRDLSALALAVV